MGNGGETKPVWPLSKRLSDLDTTRFDVVIVGSGYGGSIAASRLAAAGKTVCLLERGREILPGFYPRDLEGARKEVEVITARKGPLTPDTNAMMQLRVNDDVHVILGNGLGGGSLVNAGVSIEPDMRVFLKGWPTAYQPFDGPMPEKNTLSSYYDRVRINLGATKLPDTINLPKLTALEQSARAMKQNFERADINVTFKDSPNAFGFHQQACNMCGDCCSGCNYGAKNTLLMNYLPDAHRQGALIVTEAEVLTIVAEGSAWSLSVRDRTTGTKGDTPHAISGDMVILAAGSLGSTEILNRSTLADNGPTLSKALGTSFSTNGDVLAFGFGANLPGSNGCDNAPTPLYSIGAGVNAPTQPQYQPGPCITGVVRVDMDDSKPLGAGMLIEDGTAPGPFAALYPPGMFLQDVLTADFADFPDAQTRLDALKTLGTALQSGGDPASLSYSDVMTQMQSYLVMSHDDAGGKLAYSATTGLVHVDWLDAGRAPVYLRDNDRLKQACDAIWANFIANPIWQEGFGRQLLSVHPLGGCPMSDNDADGVTDADCRLYKGDGQNGVYDNFLVCDGSVIPRSLGVNPLLTISAITERAMDRLVGPPGPVRARPPSPRQVTAALAETAISAQPAQSGQDWDTISSDISKTSLLARAPALAALEKSSNGVVLAVTVLVAELLPDVNIDDLGDFAFDFAQNADLPGDIQPGFTRLSDDLFNLSDAISSNSNGPLGPFLNTFFGIFGDVSPGFRFDETMQGFVSDRRISQDNTISDPYEIAEGLGRATCQTLSADFTINAKSTLGHDAKGKVMAQVVGADLGGQVHLTGADGVQTVYSVTDGTFDLLQPDPDRIDTWLMTYRCKLQLKGSETATWQMTGTKVLRRRPGSFWWTDLTTLFVDLTPVDPNGPQTPQQGIIRLDLQDLAAQMASITTGFENTFTVEQLKNDAIAAANNGSFAKEIKDGSLLNKAFLVLLSSYQADKPKTWPLELAGALEKFFGAGIAEIFGNLILRAYGGYVTYMEDFPSQSDATLKALPEPGIDKVHGSLCEDIWVPNANGGNIRLFHFAPPDPTTAKGPIILAPGMSTTSLSFALLTIKPSLVERLLKENYDVWLFDSRFSPRVTPIATDYTLDDVAAEDWPTAVDHVLANTPVQGPGKGTVQILGHCVGGLTAQMAVLGGHVATKKVRQMMVLQFTVHPAANWINVAKSEIGLARDFSGRFPTLLAGIIHSILGNGADWDAIRTLLEKGVPTVNPISSLSDPDPNTDTDTDTDTEKKRLGDLYNTVTWNVPFGIDHRCYSPTCHRIYGLYGPVIAHKNLNEATHDAMRQMFGEIATKPFVQLGLIMERGRAVSADGEDIYLPNFERLRIPFHVVSGAINQIVQPESGFHTIQWLKNCMPESADLFTRTLVKGYAHNDCFIGKDANVDVFDAIMDVLRAHGQG